MKLFSAVNKKIKFREKDYVEKNYIRDDGRAWIPIDLQNIDDLYMKHDSKKLVLSDDFCNYIEEIASIIPFKYDISLEFHCKEIPQAEQDRIRRVFRNNCGMEIDDIDYAMRFSNYESIILFVVGLICFLVSYALPSNIWDAIPEFMDIAGWVIWWDMLESLFFTNNERKLKRLNKMQLYESRIEFVFDK